MRRLIRRLLRRNRPTVTVTVTCDTRQVLAALTELRKDLERLNEIREDRITIGLAEAKQALAEGISTAASSTRTRGGQASY